jgi:hypothetical protein
MAEASPFALRLSHAAHWVRCAAFVRMNRTPQAEVVDSAQDKTVTDEGTAMHWVAQMIAYGLYRDESHAPNGVELTDELIDGAEFYLHKLREYGTGWQLEHQLAAPRIHAQCGGTPDAYALYEQPADGVHIRIADLKGGFRPVDVFPNWQLIGYLAAILDNNALCYDFDDFVVEFMIVQPRVYHVDGPARKHTMRIGDVRPYIESLSMAAHIAAGEHARAVAGPQCDDCAARASCSVCHAAGMRALEVAGEPDVHDLPAAAIDYEMQRLEDAQQLIEARLTGLRAQAMHLIRKGELFPHYALESGVGRLRWIDEQAEVSALAMGDLMGHNLRKPVKAITPTQAIKLMPREFIETYAQRSTTALKLVRFDKDKAVKAFSHLKLESK